MHSKKSKPLPSSASLWAAVPRFSETELPHLARKLSEELRPGDWVLLEGPLGSGKSTFARALLSALKVPQLPEGSPTFAIAHEYLAPLGEVIHLDLYRLKSEAEIEEAGVPGYFWERDALVIAEWVSLWPIFHEQISKNVGRRACFQVSLGFVDHPEARTLEITRIF